VYGNRGSEGETQARAVNGRSYLVDAIRRHTMSGATRGGKDEVLRIMCPKLGCQRILAVPTSARGKLVRCRTCGTNIKVPFPRESTPSSKLENRDGTKSAA